MKYLILLFICSPLFAIDSNNAIDLHIHLTPLNADKVQTVKIDKHLKITYHNLKRDISVCEAALKVVHKSNIERDKVSLPSENSK